MSDSEMPPSDELARLRDQVRGSHRTALTAVVVAGLAWIAVPLGAAAFDAFTALQAGEPVSSSDFNARFDRIATAIDTLETEVSDLDGRVGTLDATVATLGADVTTLDTDLTALENEVASRQGLDLRSCQWVRTFGMATRLEAECPAGTNYVAGFCDPTSGVSVTGHDVIDGSGFQGIIDGDLGNHGKTLVCSFSGPGTSLANDAKALCCPSF